MMVKIIDQMNDVFHFGHTPQQIDFQRNSSVRLNEKFEIGLRGKKTFTLTVFTSRIRFFGMTLIATGIPSFFLTPA